ncbi:hypothetical protein [Mesorhizobium sp.]|uniref:hypothetical protein n=1 Tax=Mesorhizobium sp. TaxID=1871066 RepID=UPI000FE3F703|nr:hypothetical protein [Mesorhizobium sp.]RWI35529.1 MAG: hypothetical protein EOR14_28930 [Mesorhizobium sp.]RWJ03465.1 MAG: hypothetical protein EOR24_32310 [Mesorhizobium sp.]RWJ66302.1 MAG: hypothetical protein EOR34_28205 [Mesorhizobium sp.]
MIEKSKLIPLNEGEISELIRNSNGRPLPMSFGTGGVALQAANAPWAVKLLLEWRGVTFSDGAGI